MSMRTIIGSFLLGLIACGGTVESPSGSPATTSANDPGSPANAPPTVLPPNPVPVPTVPVQTPTSFPVGVGSGQTALAIDGTHLYFASTDAAGVEYVARTALAGGPIERIAEHKVPYDVPKELAVTGDSVFLRSDYAIYSFSKHAAGLTTLTTPLPQAVGGTSAQKLTADRGAKSAFYLSGVALYQVADGSPAHAMDTLDGLSARERAQVGVLTAGEDAVFAVTTDFDYESTPAQWASISRGDAVGVAPTVRVKIAGRFGAAHAAVSQGKLIIVWRNVIDVLDTKTLASLSTTPLPPQPDVNAFAATPTGLFFVQGQFPDPFGKLDGLMLTSAANVLAATSPVMLAEGGAPRLGASVVVDDQYVYWVRRDHKAAGSPGIIERVAK